MKKITTIFAVISMLAVSCQKESIINDENTGITTVKLTATIMPKTKVSYTVMDYIDYIDWEWPYDDYDEYDWQDGLLPAWEIGDKIIGFNNAGTTFTLTVESVAENGIATLSGTGPTNGELHLIYKYGAQTSEIINKTMTVDYSSQAGDKTMPAVMFANGTVVEGSGEFTFTNAGAVIGIHEEEGLPLGARVTSITLSGKNLSEATIALDGEDLSLTATPNPDDAISLDGLDLTVVEELDGYGDPCLYLSSPVLIAVPEGAVIEKITVSYERTIPNLAPDKEGVYYVTMAGKKWAKWNIGADTEKDCGWYFNWGGTQGYEWVSSTYIHEESDVTINQFQEAVVGSAASFVPYDSPTIEACTYYNCYPEFKKDAVITTGFSFNWENAPFNNHFSTYENEGESGDYFRSVQNTVCPDGILKLDYDAASVNWGGGWRMPTRDDFIALIIACGGAGGTNAPTPLSSANPGKGIYWVSATETYIENYAGVDGVLFCDGTSKLFFPAGCFGSNTGLSTNSITGYYWSSSLNGGGNANCLSLSYFTAKTDFVIRSRGQSIRPVSD